MSNVKNLLESKLQDTKKSKKDKNRKTKIANELTIVSSRSELTHLSLTKQENKRLCKKDSSTLITFKVSRENEMNVNDIVNYSDSSLDSEKKLHEQRKNLTVDVFAKVSLSEFV